MAKLFVVKPVLGKTKKAFLEANGFTKKAGQWVKEGSEQELQDFWDEVDVYKDKPKFASKKQKYYGWHIHGAYYLKEWEYRIFNDIELDFYLEVEKVNQVAMAA